LLASWHGMALDASVKQAWKNWYKKGIQPNVKVTKTFSRCHQFMMFPR
jgi:hypothetical protein